jgi:hypothetical protein
VGDYVRLADGRTGTLTATGTQRGRRILRGWFAGGGGQVSTEDAEGAVLVNRNPGGAA